jgi:hypothetical protein
MPRELRRLPEAEALRHWAALYTSRGGYTLGASQYRGQDDTWVEVEIPHDLYEAAWNASGAELSPSQAERAIAYAHRPWQLPPGMASFRGRDDRKKVCVIDGNHRAHASRLRGEPSARFYMPACEWERFLAVIGS